MKAMNGPSAPSSPLPYSWIQKVDLLIGLYNLLIGVVENNRKHSELSSGGSMGIRPIDQQRMTSRLANKLVMKE